MPARLSVEEKLEKNRIEREQLLAAAAQSDEKELSAVQAQIATYQGKVDSLNEKIVELKEQETALISKIKAKSNGNGAS